MQKILQKIFFTAFLGLFFAPFSFANVVLEAEICDDSGCTVLAEDSGNQILPVSGTAGETLTMNISLKNTSGNPIYSVSSWLSYDPSVIEVKGLDDSDSHFSLSAPGEFQAVSEEKVIKIGRASAGMPVSVPRANVAKIIFTVKKNPNGKMFSFVDFQKDSVGKTAVLTINNMLPENVLHIKPKNILLSVQSPNSYGNVLGTDDSVATVPNPNIYGVVNPNVSVIHSTPAPVIVPTTTSDFIGLPRPQGFRSRTYADGRSEHIWKMGDDTRIAGYYLYYSSNSGKYMHRKDIGKTNVAAFETGFFEKGKHVYFAVQAYSRSGKLSDFSDETYTVIGSEGSESHPFFEQIFPDVDPQNAVIVRDSNGNVIYKGTRKANNNYSASIIPAKNYPTPRQTVQTGAATTWLAFIAGIFLVLGGIFSLQYSRRKIFSG